MPVRVDIEPGYYLDNQQVTVTFQDNVKEVQINKDGQPPSISKYIQYDTLTPPNPFIAVTEDGQGRVVFDGGFPKMYDVHNLQATSPVMKYMINSMNWILDTQKVKDGNRKVLFLGDARSNASYNVIGSGGTNFRTSLTRLINFGGYTGSVIKSVHDYGNGFVLDPTFQELNQYQAVFVMSTVYTGGARFTQQAIDQLVTYRELGGGLMFMTDHGPDLPDIQSQINNASGFFQSQNQVITRFGQWFSGNYNRIPVNVGFLIDNYGQHPLWQGLTRQEYIPQGGSESRVYVTSDPLYSPEDVQKIYNTSNGKNLINVLAVLDDGEMVPVKFEYNIVDYQIDLVLDGRVYQHGQIADVQTKNFLEIGFQFRGVDRNVTGDVLIDNIKIGTVNKTINSDVVYTPLVQDKKNNKNIIHINNNQAININFTNPQGLIISVITRRTLQTEFEELYPLHIQDLQQIYRTEEYAPEYLIKGFKKDRGIFPLPNSIELSKRNTKQVYGYLEPHIMDSRNISNQQVGYQINNGSLTPSTDDNNFIIQSLNSQPSYPLELQLRYTQTHQNNSNFKKPVAIYLNGTGPYYYLKEVLGSGIVNYHYSNGITNIFDYINSRIGQDMEVRFIYQD